ncbi:hypothetical protein AVEN_38257-1, partial [Araneus ventricosus]
TRIILNVANNNSTVDFRFDYAQVILRFGVGAAFCVLTNDIWAYQWSAKLNDNNTVFQAELTALHEAVIYASHLPNHNTSKIHVDNRASIMASSNSKSTNETARKIFKILLSNPRIKVSWVGGRQYRQ